MKRERIHEILKNLREVKELERKALTEKSSDLYYTLRIDYERSLKRASVELLFELSLIQSELTDKINLLDYRVGFEYFDTMDDTTYELRGSITDYTKIMLSYLRSNKTHVSEIKNNLFLNANDVAIIDFKTPSYIIQTKKAEKRLKEIGLIKNHYTTELNSLVCKYRKSLVDPKTFDDLPFKYDNLMEFLKNLVENNFDDDFKSVANKFIRSNPQVIEQLRLNL